MDSAKRSETTHNLEINYQTVSHRTDLVVKDEEARRLKLRTLLLRGDNATIRDELALKEEHIKQLVAKHDAIHEQLQNSTQKAHTQEKQMRIQARELANLREEMNSLANVTQDSAKVLTEKLALSRELAVLKPEIEHLKSQVAHQKDVLAEKLALERHLNAVEVELANVKRTAEKAAHRQQGRDSDAAEELRQQVRDLEKQLAKEKRAAQKAVQGQDTRSAEVDEELKELKEHLAETEKMLAAERRAASKASKTKEVAEDVEAVQELEQLRVKLAETERALGEEKEEKARIRKEAEKSLAEAEGQRLPLEERIDNLKAKLREAREQLKTAPSELERTRAAPVTSTTTTVATKKPAAKAAPTAKKRRANEIGAQDNILQTPSKDDDRPRRSLKRVFAPAAVGEKSNFSITPFLNKTINLSDVSLKPIAEDTTDEQDMDMTTDMPTEQAAPKEAASRANAKAKKQPPTARPKPTKAALTESSPSKQNVATASKSHKAAGSLDSFLEKVTEGVNGAADQENRPVDVPAAKESAPPKKKRLVPKAKAAASPVPLESATATATEAAVSTTSVKPFTAAAEWEQAAPEPKKKKRRLVGGPSTSKLFGGGEDAEDAGAPAAPVPVPALAVKRAPMSRVNLGGLAAKRAVGEPKNAFGGASFSPLKRDRRGVGASFLA